MIISEAGSDHDLQVEAHAQTSLKPRSDVVSAGTFMLEVPSTRILMSCDIGPYWVKPQIYHLLLSPLTVDDWDCSPGFASDDPVAVQAQARNPDDDMDDSDSEGARARRMPTSRETTVVFRSFTF